MIKRCEKLVITFYTTTAAMDGANLQGVRCRWTDHPGSGQHFRRLWFGPVWQFGEISALLCRIFSMPPTSGGLLFAVPEGEAETCLAQLKQAIPNAAVVGYVTQKEDSYIILE